MDNIIQKTMAKILSEMAYLIVVEHKSGTEAAELTKKSLVDQCGITELESANIIRLTMGIYLNEQEYAELALKKLIVCSDLR
jgi:hypothetical protein